MLQRGTVRKAAGGVYDVELDEGGVVAAAQRGRLNISLLYNNPIPPEKE